MAKHVALDLDPSDRTLRQFGFIALAAFGLLGQLLSYVLLALLFYGVFGAVGILLRVFARDPMTRVYNATAQSYWVPRRRTPDVESYLRQS